MQFKFTTKIKLAIIAAAVVVCLASAYFLLFGQQIKKLIGLSTQLQAMEVSFAKNKKDESYVPKLERDIYDNNRKISLIRRRLPNDVNIAELVQDLAQIGSRLGIKEYSSIVPGSVVTIDKYTLVPIQVIFGCSYPKLIEYLKELEKMQRLTRVDGLFIKVNDLDPEEMQIALSLTAFTMLEPAKKAEPAKK
ncbi:MAG: type 4a pilus biogenesis protein PilO [bacterium]|nr:type 4a pilus biogenesis protein PilO [bacterium]MDD5353881.1 type 4a pilus biogenesis protein PilO [bacterium]MDD5756390.1 type 4a pilus biogenesis protein PilO [bacterium]